MPLLIAHGSVGVAACTSDDPCLLAERAASCMHANSASQQYYLCRLRLARRAMSSRRPRKNWSVVIVQWQVERQQIKILVAINRPLKAPVTVLLEVDETLAPRL